MLCLKGRATLLPPATHEESSDDDESYVAECRRALRAAVPYLDVLRRLVVEGHENVAGHALELLAGPILRVRGDRGKIRRSLAFDTDGPYPPPRPPRRCKKVARKSTAGKAPRKQLAIKVLRQFFYFHGHLPAEPHWPQCAVDVSRRRDAYYPG